MEDKIIITRIFDAPREKIWEAWTTPELIKKWWGPEGFSAPSIKIDFRVGGKYIYAMRGPKGSEWDRVMYSSGIFKEIVPPSAGSGQAKIVATDYFSDKDGNKIKPSDEGQDKNFPTEIHSTILFEDLGNGKTMLSIIYPKPENEAQFEAMKRSGMEEGWMSSLDKLADVIK
jgi:uncharacterized protein YndB with AHSA1/START domain